MKVTVHEDLCVGAGQCVRVAPEVFDQREEDGVVVLLLENPPAEVFERVREAAILCPSMAIDVDE